MINKKLIKDIAEKRDKKIGISAIKKIEEILTTDVEKLILRASRQADFSGRKIIKEEDIVEEKEEREIIF